MKLHFVANFETISQELDMYDKYDSYESFFNVLTSIMIVYYDKFIAGNIRKFGIHFIEFFI